MIRVVNEPAAVLSRFKSGGFAPVRMRWRSHDVRVRDVTGRWNSPDGQYKIYNFAVVGEGDAYYEISFRTRDMTWYVDKVMLED